MRVRANTCFTVLDAISFMKHARGAARRESGTRVIWEVVKMILDGTFMNVRISVWHNNLDSG